MNEDNKTKELWYMPAVRMVAGASGWFAGPIIIALILGKYLDNKYDSDPWFLIGLTGVAFIFSIFGILKILTKYLKEIEREADEKKKLLEENQNLDK